MEFQPYSIFPVLRITGEFIYVFQKIFSFIITALSRHPVPRLGWEQDLDQHSWISGLHSAYPGMMVWKNQKLRINYPRKDIS